MLLAATLSAGTLISKRSFGKEEFIYLVFV